MTTTLNILGSTNLVVLSVCLKIYPELESLQILIKQIRIADDTSTINELFDDYISKSQWESEVLKQIVFEMTKIYERAIEAILFRRYEAVFNEIEPIAKKWPEEVYEKMSDHKVSFLQIDRKRFSEILDSDLISEWRFDGRLDDRNIALFVLWCHTSSVHNMEDIVKTAMAEAKVK